MARSVCLISLLPLSATGGGERFSMSSAEAVAASGDACEVFSPENMLPHHAPLQQRLDARFVQVDARTPHHRLRTLDYRAVLNVAARSEVILLHQFLASDLVFDLIANVCSDQELLFTTLGYEPLRELFADLYQPCRNHHFIEISDFAAQRSKVFGKQAFGVAAGVWRADLRELCPVKAPGGICALGRVLPHKGLEVTIEALPAGMHLSIVGPSTLDPAYTGFLRQRAAGRLVDFMGRVDDRTRLEILARSRVLVASSCTTLHTGQVLEQAELLGLVIFEALAQFCLPIVSDVPPFREVMSGLALQDWIYPQRDSGALRQLLVRAGHADLYPLILDAREQLLGRFDWDTYWSRVCRCL